MTVSFAGCRLDLDSHRLFRGPDEIHLSPKAFELLKLLVENRPRVIAKVTLLESVWPGLSVSDASLAKAVNEIRSAVGDEARRARIIRTVHRYGYGFMSDVESESEPEQVAWGRRRPRCWLMSGKHEFPLPNGEHIAGRDADAGIWIDSPRISRRHAKLIVSGADATIVDLGSKNGTFVRGARVSAGTKLQPGDRIHLGGFKLVFHVGPAAATTDTEIAPRGRRRN